MHSLLKIEDVNFVDSNPNKPHRQLFGYAIAAKRYALYTQTRKDISIVWASGHVLGYLFAPKENATDREQIDKAPEWVLEAWDWLLRKETRIQIEGTRLARTPGHDANGDDITKCDAYELARMVSAVQLLFLPTIADLGGYPAGFDRSNFKFIVPPESNRRKWKTLKASIYWMCWVGEPIKSAWFRTSNKEMLFPNQCESS